jgi:hypothetical protein
MAKNIFKLQKNKRFYYKPRFYKGAEDGNVYSMQSKFDISNRKDSYNDYKAQWSKARADSRNRDNAGVNYRLLIIVAILVFVVLFVLDFDLSIFRKQ